MRKILIFTYSYGQGGSELNALKVIKLSSQIKFDWIVINEKKVDLLHILKTCKNLNQNFSLDLYTSKSFKIFKCIYSLILILIKGEYQTVYAVGFMPGLLISLLKSFFKFRFISTRRERMPWAKIYHLPFIYFINLMSNYIETNSKNIEANLRKSNITKNKVYFIPNIILNYDKSKHLIFANKKKRYIGNVANVRNPKNIDLFLSIALKMIKKNKDLIFLLVGKDSADKKVNNFIEKNKLNNSLIVLENISYDNIFSIYYGLDIFLFTSIYEGSPNVLYEAMSANVPIVASRILATEELIDNNVNGYLCSLDNENEFIEKINLLINDKKQMEIIKKNMNEYFNKLNFNEIAQKEINDKIIWYK